MANINTVETRDKFGVPLAGNQGNGILMPKLQYRFRVTMLAGFGGEPQSRTLTQNVQSVTRPTVTFPEVIVDSYNSKSYIHGKHEWSTIDLVVRDDITNATSRLVGAQLQRQVNFFQQTTPAAGNDYKFDMQVETMDGTNAGPTEVFYLEGAFLQNVTYGQQDYSVNDPVQITMTVRFDNCTHYQGDNDINGRLVGGNPFPDPEVLNEPGIQA